MVDIASGSFTFDGDMATKHRLPARHLGPALDGLDTIVSSLFGLLESKRVQARRPRSAALLLTVAEPRAGSYDLAWIAQVAPGLLPLVPDFVSAIQAKLAEYFVNYVMMWFGGRRREADALMEKMLDLMARDHERQHEDRQREREAIYADARDQRSHVRQLLHEQALMLHNAARKVVTPVGQSADTFRTGVRSGDSPVVDTATADAIRAKEEVEVSDILEMSFQIEGIRDQRRVLFVFDPEDEKLQRVIPAIIADPVFELPGNIYKTAYASGAPITLTGKTTRPLGGGPIKTFHAISAKLD